MPTQRKLVRQYRDSVRKIAGKYERQAGWIGITSTQIETGTPDLIYVRLVNGQAVKAVNKLAPLVYNYPVVIARADSSANWEVVEVRQPYGGTNLSQMKDHHANHEYPARDTVWIKDAQILPFLVLPNGDLTVSLFGGVMEQDGNYYTVENQSLDLETDIPSTGAVWALIEIIAGTVTVTLSAEVTGRESLTADNIPISTGMPLCAIRLYGGMDEIKRDNSVNDFVDLRFTSDPSNKIELQNYSFLFMGA